jgi:hypothetical protein
MFCLTKARFSWMYVKSAMLLFCLCSAFVAANAITIVAPNDSTSVEGNGVSSYPLAGSNIGSGGPVAVHYQQVFSASQFDALDPASVFTAIAFRPNVGEKASSITYTSFQLTLSTTTARPDFLSTLFANNLGSDAKVVYSGALSLATTSIGTPTKPANFDASIPFQSSFAYDPSQGNLLVDIVLSGPNTNSTSFFLDAANTAGDSVSSLLAATGGMNPSGPTGSASTTGTVIQFTSTVPEPSTFVLCASFAALFYLWRRGTKRTRSQA